MRTSQSRLPGEITFMLLIVAFSSFMLWASFKISRFEALTSAGAFPMLCAGAMLVTGLMSLRQSLRAKLQLENGETAFGQFVRKLAPLTLVLFTLLIVAYMLLLEVLGFIVSSYLFLLLSMQVLGSRRLLVNLAASAVVLASIYIIFQTAFSVVLPPGSLIGPYLPEFLK